MCKKILFGSDEFDEIITNIKNDNLSRNNMPKLIIGTGLSASYNIPGMGKLAIRLDKKLSKDANINIRNLWNAKAPDIKKEGLEEGLKTLASTETKLVEAIRKVTAEYILDEEEKLHGSILKKDSGFSKLMQYLKNTCSVNNGILDVMTPNYDRTIEIVCDKLKINVITGFTGQIYQSFQPLMLKRPALFYQMKNNFYVRLFKPHGSLNWIAKEGKEYLINDYKILKQECDHIEIITPGSFKYEEGMINNTFRNMREEFNEIISNEAERFSLFIFGYGFNDPHFNTVLLQNTGKNMLIVSREVKEEILERALVNHNMTIFYYQRKRNYMIYKGEKYEIDRDMWNLDVFADVIIG